MGQDHQERIRQRAHQIWESEGRPDGRDAEHWSRAQEELKNEMGNEQPAKEAEPQLAQTVRPARSARSPKTAKASADEPAKPRRNRKTATSPDAASEPHADAVPTLNDGP